LLGFSVCELVMSSFFFSGVFFLCKSSRGWSLVSCLFFSFMYGIRLAVWEVQLDAVRGAHGFFLSFFPPPLEV